MLFPLWPPVAVVALLMMLTIMIILIYGDKICARVRTHTDRIAVRVPRPSLEPMIRMSGGGERRPRHEAPQEQAYHQPQQQAYHEQHLPQRYSPQQHQQRYEAPMELQKQSTTYGHREIEV